jgi:hypothetical protein
MASIPQKPLFAAVIASVVLLSVCPVWSAQTESSWNSDEGSWNEPSNWSPQVVPNNSGIDTYAVIIDRPGEVLIELGEDAQYMIDSLDTYGEVILEPALNPYTIATLVVLEPNGLTNHGMLEMMRTLMMADVVNTDGGDLQLSDVLIEGNVQNDPGCGIEIEDSVGIEGQLKSAGEVSLFGSGLLQVENGLVNSGWMQLNGGSVEIEGGLDINGGTIAGTGLVHLDEPGDYQNSGWLFAQNGPLQINVNGAIINHATIQSSVGADVHLRTSATSTNHGSIKVIGGNVSCSSEMVNAFGGQIHVMGGSLQTPTLRQKPDGEFHCYGDVFGAVVVEANAAVHFNGDCRVFGPITIEPNGRLEVSDGRLIATDPVTNDGTIRLHGGQVVPRGGYSGSGQIVWNQSAFSNAADFNLDGNVNFKDFATFANTWLWTATP